jgi:hypothetical protein
VSIITIKGNGCSITNLGKVSDATEGKVTRVDPSNIAEDLKNLLQKKVIGTQTVLELRLHKGLKLKNEESVEDSGSLCVR